MKRALAIAPIAIMAIACRRERAPDPTPAPAPVASVTAKTSSMPAPMAPPDSGPREAFGKMLTLSSGNPNPLAKPNVWVYLPSAFRVHKPLHVAFIFHGFNNCLHSIVADASVVCKPDQPARTAYDLPAQIEKSGVGAIVIVPQLAFDEKNGDPGVIDNAAALEKLAVDALDAIGVQKPVDRVTMIAMSGGYQALYANMNAFEGKLRDVFLLDAYYTEAGAVDAWLTKNVADFETHKLRLGVIYSNLEIPRTQAVGFAKRAAQVFKQTVHKSEPHEITVEELTHPVVFAYSNAEHDDIPRTDIAKVLAATTK